ncbi:MAG TPA: hypothetical protein VLF62_06580 [Candidatus Saccharimonadales bacterium]|nr:hypothetical protein [Candidatus Saccharimonadales bacterium]
MKRNMLIGGGIIAVAIVAVVAIVLAQGGSGSGNKPAGTPAKTAYKVVAACQAFTLKDAEKVLGAGASAGTTNGTSDTSSDDVAVSTCSYSSGGGQDVQSTKTITVLARSAKSQAGAESNKAVFGRDKPVGKQDVSGVGDAAFWDAAMSQLDILQGNNWYIIGNMTGTHSNSGTLEASRAVYDQIESKL